jgi:hypothetical protein
MPSRAACATASARPIASLTNPPIEVLPRPHRAAVDFGRRRRSKSSGETTSAPQTRGQASEGRPAVSRVVAGRRSR